MLLGCIADDFTGAGDLANTLAREGMRTRLFIGADGVSDTACDAGVVALKSRSIPADQAVRQSLQALDRLRAAGCRQFLFKYCSTFDSTPAGNIGPVAEALAEALDAPNVIVCPAFPATGRTVYQGHLFVGDALLSDSGMERHPLTPMTDPDLRRWLRRQSSGPVGHVAHAVVRQGTPSIRAALAQSTAGLVIVDAVDEVDLRAIGEAAADAPLVTGGSGIALGLPDNFRRAGHLPARASDFVPQAGPAIVLSGSCSRATQAQVAAYRVDHPAYRLDIDRLLGGEDVAAEATAFLAAHARQAPLVYSTNAPEAVASAQQRHGTSTAAEAVESFFGQVALDAAARGVSRIVVAGGETSGAVVTALGLSELTIGPEIDPGVPALSTVTPGGTPLALALKSGNFGAPDFMAKALQRLEGNDD